MKIIQQDIVRRSGPGYHRRHITMRSKRIGDASYLRKIVVQRSAECIVVLGILNITAKIF